MSALLLNGQVYAFDLLDGDVPLSFLFFLHALLALALYAPVLADARAPALLAEAPLSPSPSRLSFSLSPCPDLLAFSLSPCPLLLSFSIASSPL